MAGLLFSACNSEKNQEKALLDEVIKLHDKVMANEEKLMQNKMKLDTLILDSTLQIENPVAEKIIMGAFRKELVKADAQMEKWMQNFDPSQKGKTHAEIVTYLDKQKKEIITVDSVLAAAVKGSDDYLLKFKK